MTAQQFVDEGYNRDDCASTLYLRDWLERLRVHQIENRHQIERPQRWRDGKQSADRQAALAVLVDRTRDDADALVDSELILT
jgi:hypothetical protein